MKRTKLSERILPCYTKSEEVMNTVTHIIGGGLSCIMLACCVLKPLLFTNISDLAAAIIYGISLISVYTISSIYHGLHPGTGKKVMQIIDHCMIYFLIAGTYTPILVNSFIPVYPEIGFLLLLLEWGLGITAATLTAIDLRKYKVFSMISYIFMGWGMILFLPQALDALGHKCFFLILSGGIIYTVGAIFFAIGTKIKWMHSVFHIFVIIGSILHFIGIIQYVL